MDVGAAGSEPTAGSLDTAASDVNSVDVGSLDLSGMGTVEVTASRGDQPSAGTLDMGGFQGTTAGTLDTDLAGPQTAAGSLDMSVADLGKGIGSPDIGFIGGAQVVDFSQGSTLTDYGRAAVVGGVTMGLANNVVGSAAARALTASGLIATGGMAASMSSVKAVVDDFANNLGNLAKADPRNLAVFFAGHDGAAPTAATVVNDGGLTYAAEVTKWYADHGATYTGQYEVPVTGGDG